MVKKKNTIFISFSSKDIGHEGYVQAVESAIHCIGDYEADHMNTGVIDARVTQGELDERIRRSRLVIMVLDQQYKDCENLRREYEKVTKRGSKITVLIFIKKYHTREEETVQKENIFSVLNINENRYVRFEDAEDLQKNAEIQLNRWYKEEELPRIERNRKMRQVRIFAIAAFALVFCFWWAVHYKMPHPENTFDNNADTIIVDPVPVPKPGPGTISDPVPTPKPEPVTEPVPSVVVMLNTFSVVCDDELFSAGISDAVSQVLPTLSQSADTSKAQWTISVKQYTVQEIPKMIDSDALQVDVDYTVDIINNVNNKKSSRLLPIRGRSIIQNRDDAIRSANEEATKEIANILKSMQQ